MGNNDNLIWGVALALLAGLLFYRQFRRKAAPQPADEGEKPPALVEGTAVVSGTHRGVKYWIYYEAGLARLEIEAGEEVTLPFIADRRTGPAKLPGDARDADLLELFKLRAVYVDVAVSGALAAAHFPERNLNLNAGTTLPPSPVEAVANTVVELLTAIREKSRKPAGAPAAQAPLPGNR